MTFQEKFRAFGARSVGAKQRASTASVVGASVPTAATPGFGTLAFTLPGCPRQAPE
jgi:hypothetical protein